MKRFVVGLIAAACAMAALTPVAARADSTHWCRAVNQPYVHPNVRPLHDILAAKGMSCPFVNNIAYFYAMNLYHGDCAHTYDVCNIGSVYSPVTRRGYDVICTTDGDVNAVDCWIKGEQRTLYADWRY